jgi:hypothetical protein
MAEVPVTRSLSEEEQRELNREFYETVSYDEEPPLEEALAATQAWEEEDL